MSESELVQSILLEFGTRPGLRIWRNNTGAARSRTGALVRFGVPGQGDISGLRQPNGQRIEIECKTKRGRQSTEQRRFQAMIEAHNGLYVLARSVDDVREALQ